MTRDEAIKFAHEVSQYENSRQLLAFAKAFLREVEPVSLPTASGPYTLEDVNLIEQQRGKPYERLRETVMALIQAETGLTAAGQRIDALVKHHGEKHTNHCWARLSWGDGECECRHEAAFGAGATQTTESSTAPAGDEPRTTGQPEALEVKSEVSENPDRYPPFWVVRCRNDRGEEHREVHDDAGDAVARGEKLRRFGWRAVSVLEVE